MIQCDTGRVIYVSDSITPVLNQTQVCLHTFVTFFVVSLSPYFQHTLLICKTYLFIYLYLFLVKLCPRLIALILQVMFILETDRNQNGTPVHSVMQCELSGFRHYAETTKLFRPKRNLRRMSIINIRLKTKLAKTVQIVVFGTETEQNFGRSLVYLFCYFLYIVALLKIFVAVNGLSCAIKKLLTSHISFCLT